MPKGKGLLLAEGIFLFLNIDDIEFEPLSPVSFMDCFIFWILLLNNSIISAFI